MGRKKSEVRKKEIVQSSLDLIAEKGIRNLTTARIADRVGFSEAALYKHFTNKEEILESTIEAAGKRLFDALKKAEEDKGGLEKIKNVLKAHLKFVEENPGVARLLFSDEIHFNREKLRTKLSQVTEEVMRFVQEILESGIDSGEVRKDLDVEAGATFYLGIFQSQVLFWSLSGGQSSLTGRFDQLWGLYQDLLKGNVSGK